MYYLNGNPLRLDKAFTDADGNQYPANWLRNSTPEQRDALGITWVAPDPAASYDQRFYWGVGNPKDIDQLKELWIQKQKEIAGSLLAPTDWHVIRMTEDANCMCPPGVVQYRADVRAVSNTREAEISACLDTDELVALLTAPAQIPAEEQPNPEVVVMADNPAALTQWPNPV